MAELPKIVRARLARQPEHGAEATEGSGPSNAFGPGFHPDANLLSAFAERALTADERERVLCHLADCEPCRELVALAFPSPEVETDVAGVSAAPRWRWFALPTWLGWRSLRWGVLAASAGVVLVGAFRLGLLRWPSNQPASKGQTTAKGMVAERAPSTAVVASRSVPGPSPTDANAIASRAETKQLALATNQPASPARQLRGQPAPRKELEQALRVPDQRAGADGVFSKDRSRPVPAAANEADALVRREQEKAPLAAARPAAPPPADYAQSSASSAGAGIAGGLAPPEQQQRQQQQVTAEAIQIQGQPATAADKKAIPGAKDARDSLSAPLGNARAQTGAAGGSLDARTYQVQRLMAKAKAELKAYWTISDGKIERSRAPSGPWQEVTVDRTVAFRAVAADGASVWAGGSAGALYHSTDAGEHWTRVRVGSDQKGSQAPATGVTGSIVRIRFSDAEHGVIVTDAGETWTTTDGGAHWKLASSAR